MVNREFRIAVDAMGGDNAPADIVNGAILASERGIPILLAGDREVIETLLESSGAKPSADIQILHCEQVVEMEEEGAFAVREKPDSSINKCAESVIEGRCSAIVSAGNTGAALAAGFFNWGRLKGIKRPAIITEIPPYDSPTFLLDCGANSDCRPDFLFQFALMGCAYARIRGCKTPSVGLLNIGEEERKGNELTKAAYELLKEQSVFDFRGNAEARDLSSDKWDVIVTDGFTGNVVLKTYEGAIDLIREGLSETFPKTEKRIEETPSSIDSFLEEYDWQAKGGAHLLGLKNIMVISHGSSNAKAIMNAVLTAWNSCNRGLIGELELEFGKS